MTDAKDFVPTPQQEAIFGDIANGESNTVTVARAGTGKTSTIIRGLDYLPPGLAEDTILVAFNEGIKKELAARAPAGVKVQTLHGYGLGNAMWCLPQKPKVDNDKLARIVSGVSGDREVKAALRDLVPACKANLCHSQEAIDCLIDDKGIVVPSEIDREDLIDLARRCLRASRDDTGSIDFDDMIWWPCVFDWGLRAYSRVFVDETQDLNPAQIKLALGAVRTGGRVMAIGDDRQAIYQFRGADTDAVPRVIRELEARTLKLTVTFRCCQSVTALARRWVPDFECPETAPVGVVRELEGYEKILAGARAGDFVLSRTNAPLIRLFYAFVRRGVRVSVQGKGIKRRILSLIRKSRTEHVGQMLEWVARWGRGETERLVGLDRDPSGVGDLVEAMGVIAEGCDSISGVIEKVERLFGDEKVGTEKDRIVLSTVHRAKGLEREKVWLLRDTFLRSWRRGEDGEPLPPSQEEINIWYVAITRARDELNLVWSGGA